MLQTCLAAMLLWLSLIQYKLYVLVLVMLPVLPKHNVEQQSWYLFSSKEKFSTHAMLVYRQHAASGAEDFAQPEAHRGRHHR